MAETGYEIIKKFKDWVQLYEYTYNELSTNKPINRRLDELEEIIKEAREYHKEIIDVDINQLEIEL